MTARRSRDGGPSLSRRSMEALGRIPWTKLAGNAEATPVRSSGTYTRDEEGSFQPTLRAVSERTARSSSPAGESWRVPPWLGLVYRFGSVTLTEGVTGTNSSSVEALCLQLILRTNERLRPCNGLGTCCCIARKVNVTCLSAYNPNVNAVCCFAVQIMSAAQHTEMWSRGLLLRRRVSGNQRHAEKGSGSRMLASE